MKIAYIERNYFQTILHTMAKKTDDTPIEIRTFASYQEIEKLPGFNSEKPHAVNNENYKCLLGDYWIEDEVNCCFQKDNGNLCLEGHKFGFVVKLIDGGITIVGNQCASKRFGADSSIKQDKNKYLNEKRRREKFASLFVLLDNKEQHLVTLNTALNSVQQAQKRVRDFISKLEPATYQALKSMARTNSSAVMVNAITYNKYTDDDGEEKTERRIAPTKLGNLNGMSIFLDSAFSSIRSASNSVKSAYEKAEHVSEKIRAADLDNLTATINDIDRIVSEVGVLLKNETLFFGNDLLLLCFLVDEKSERYKTAKTVLEHGGQVIGKDKAKNLLLEKEKMIKKSLGADRISVRI